MEEIEVRIARDSETRACLALLPEAHGRDVELVIARSKETIHGAAAIHWQSWQKPAGFPVWARVVEDSRRKGLGRRLIDAAADLVADETDGLWPFKPVPKGDPAAAFMTATGWRPGRRQLFFRARIETLLADISPLLSRLRRRGGDATEVVIAPVGPAHFETLGWLISAELGGGPFGAAEAMRRMADTPELGDRSQVALIGGEPAGVILWNLREGEAVVEGRVVAERWRGGPINLLLLEAGLLRGLADGLIFVNFHCDDTVRDTIALARRAQAEQMAAKATYYRPVDLG